MMRQWLELAAACAVGGALFLGYATSAAAGPEQGGAEPKAPVSSPAKTDVKWVVSAIELSTKSSNPFVGRVVLEADVAGRTSYLSYYWGGKCKGSKLPRSRLDLLVEAMKQGWRVEIPSFPIRHDDVVVMCIQSVRVSRR